MVAILETKRQPDTFDVGALGEAKLKSALTPELLAERHGQVVVVDVDTGEMAFGKTIVDCCRHMTLGDAARRYAARVGVGSVYRFGGVRAGVPQ